MKSSSLIWIFQHFSFLLHQAVTLIERDRNGDRAKGIEGDRGCRRARERDRDRERERERKWEDRKGRSLRERNENKSKLIIETALKALSTEVLIYKAKNTILKTLPLC